jgi:hypothetical protein
LLGGGVGLSWRLGAKEACCLVGVGHFSRWVGRLSD